CIDPGRQFGDVHRPLGLGHAPLARDMGIGGAAQHRSGDRDGAVRRIGWRLAHDAWFDITPERGAVDRRCRGDPRRAALGPRVPDQQESVDQLLYAVHGGLGHSAARRLPLGARRAPVAALVGVLRGVRTESPCGVFSVGRPRQHLDANDPQHPARRLAEMGALLARIRMVGRVLLRRRVRVVALRDHVCGALGGRDGGDVSKARVREDLSDSSRMPYPEYFVAPMRQELTRLGVQELRTPDEVDAAVRTTPGALMIVVNSVCGCAAGKARPGIALALHHRPRPDRVATVFAGADTEATDRARSYFTGFAPSSPSVGLLRNGELVFMLERAQIENRTAEQVAAALTAAFDRFCEREAVVPDRLWPP